MRRPKYSDEEMGGFTFGIALGIGALLGILLGSGMIELVTKMAEHWDIRIFGPAEPRTNMWLPMAWRVSLTEALTFYPWVYMDALVYDEEPHQ